MWFVIVSKKTGFFVEQSSSEIIALENNQDNTARIEKICGQISFGGIYDACINFKVPSATLSEWYTDCVLDAKLGNSVPAAEEYVEVVKLMCDDQRRNAPEIPNDIAQPEALRLPADYQVELENGLDFVDDKDEPDRETPDLMRLPLN